MRVSLVVPIAQPWTTTLRRLTVWPPARDRIMGRLPAERETSMRFRLFPIEHVSISSFIMQAYRTVPAMLLLLLLLNQHLYPAVVYLYDDKTRRSSEQGRGFWVRGFVWGKAEAARAIGYVLQISGAIGRVRVSGRV